MQWLAMITMLIDHLGYAFFSDERYLRIIGRIAFPIYCYLLVVGYRHTRNVNKYMTRLLIIALVSQFPFMFAFNIENLNVVFTLLIGLLLIMLLDRIPTKLFPLSIVLAAGFSAIAELLHTDYGAYGILLILIYRYVPGYMMVLAHFALTVIFVLAGHMSLIQIYSIFSTLLITAGTELRPDVRLIAPPRWLWRAFYPAHLAIIAIMVQGSAYGYFNL
ncbi:TraX family protein [Paenibacillus wulumuqiensis]|uniref:TraX family protein n=1 Tax=Paenibacillus wulumuqiensis TaxID=1567107 RepID=UPI000619AD4A|nr:TraX family protein [Paenibacillus wulumuqiensis]